MASDLAARGLSPRVRGNPLPGVHLRLPARSIPARAGQPPCRPIEAPARRVYPRACGATLGPHVEAMTFDTGLSPRVRGNLSASRAAANISGSIPARAGQPCITWWRRAGVSVYPRACGATRRQSTCPPPRAGLSPRVRGNRKDLGAPDVLFRSIPARAGQPATDDYIELSPTVYPRACGATRPPSAHDWLILGLSPRVRGNPHQKGEENMEKGSIPARAGQPGCRRQRLKSKTVYPRACGATDDWSLVVLRYEGLSPRVRGNRGTTLTARTRNGSIPARAGQPYGSWLPIWRPGVYPRACGATPVP